MASCPLIGFLATNLYIFAYTVYYTPTNRIQTIHFQSRRMGVNEGDKTILLTLVQSVQCLGMIHGLSQLFVCDSTVVLYSVHGLALIWLVVN